MSVVDIHPEDLLDKLARDELSSSERSHLQTHLSSCAVCRLELELRRDFQREAAAVDVSKMPQQQLAGTLKAPSAAHPKRRSRAVFWGVVGAGVVSATAAVASVVAGRLPWQTTVGGDSPAASAAAVAPHPRPAIVLTVMSAAVPAPTATAALPEEATEAGASEALRGASDPQAPAAAVSAESGQDAALDLDPGRSPSTLFAAANLARRRGEISRATELYRLLQTRFPASEEASLSLVTLAKLKLDRGNAAGALGLFNRYLNRSGRPLEAEALVGRANALRRVGRRSEEAMVWRSIAQKYPGSAYAKQANERLTALSGP